MRAILIMITLLAGGTFGYSFAGRIRGWESQGDIREVLQPKGDSDVPRDTSKKLRAELDTQELSQRRDWWAIRSMSAATAALGFWALVLERKRHDAKPSV